MSENRYAAIEFYIPKAIHENLDYLLARGESHSLPFSRQIDLWWAGLCIGLKLGEQASMPAEVSKFAQGTILSSDPWRITHLDLIALSLGGPEMLESPAEIVRAASEYANAGMRHLADALLGTPDPALTFLNWVEEWTPA